MEKLFQINKYLFILILLYLFYGCEGQSANLDACKINIRIARENIKSFYQTNNKQLLLDAINNANQSVQCGPTRIAGVEIKLSIYMLLKEYKTGQTYLDSLKEEDFKLRYKKNFWYNYLGALEAESNSDTAERSKYYNKIIDNVDNYIKTNDSSSGMLDKEPYYDLFFIKSKILTREDFNKQVDNVEIKYRSDSTFLQSLKTTFYRTSADSNSIIN